MEKVRRKNSRHYIDNMSIKNSFVFYALISLVIGIVIGVISITLVDDYRINLNYKYEDMTTRYDIPENGSFTAKYNKVQINVSAGQLTCSLTSGCLQYQRLGLPFIS